MLKLTFGLQIFTFAIIYMHLNSVECNICSSDGVDNSEPCFDLQSFNYNLNRKAQQTHSIQLDCYVKNKGSYSVVWMHENQLISLDDKVIKPDSNIKLDTDLEKKFNLKINNLDMSHKGAYKCQITTLNAKNMDYNLDVLVPPTITRLPNNDVISVNEGQSVTIQCLAQGNPKPKVTWTKKGKLPANLKIDETKSTLTLRDMDQSYIDTYSCMAMNGVGNPVTSEFQIQIKYKPRVKIVAQENQNKSVMYTAIARKEQIVCMVNAYPRPKITLLHKNSPVQSSDVMINEKNSDQHEYVLTYKFETSSTTIGEYTCQAENELSVSRESVTVTTSVSEITISSDHQVYSDGFVFEWSCLSGSPITETELQFLANETQVVSTHLNKIKKHFVDGENVPSYLNENILYRDVYEVESLSANSTYTIRLRIRNELNEWSVWSRKIYFVTKSDVNHKIDNHKALHKAHNRNQHERKYKFDNYKSHSRLDAFDSSSGVTARFDFVALLFSFLATLVTYSLMRN